ncbi:MAG: sigma-70 family RNA polymerase sigma factor [Acidimicrobiia bacterium]|nr:sigma-70 family RNA polymerase sigma factor [Acidimicrobiia bacterium]
MAEGTGEAEAGLLIDIGPQLRARRRAAGVVDEAVLAAAKAGDPHAWAQLYRWLAGPVRGYLAGRGAVALDDLTGEVFVQLSRGIHRFEGDLAQFRSWVFMVAHNRLLDERRRQRRERSDPTAPEDIEEPSGGGGNVELEALTALGEAAIRTMLAPLTDDQRTVLLLRFVADLSLEDVAKAMVKPVGAIKQLQLRALRSLQRRQVGDGVTDLPAG